MFARISVLFVSAACFCQIAAGQSYNQALPLPSDAAGAARAEAAYSPGAYAGSGYTPSIYPSPDPGSMMPGYGYGASSGMPGQLHFGDAGYCSTESAGYYYPPHWAHRWFFWSYWKIKGLPSPWHAPGNLTQHVPYVAEPKNYYSFRPYNWFHLPEQQAEAARYETDPRNPYDNRVVYDGLYDGLE